MIGEVPASARNGAPTVLVYAHLDVQPPDPLELWESDPWALVERDGKLVARGVADDKAHLFMLLKASELLAGGGRAAGERQVAIDAEEEIGGHSIVDWVEEDTGPADAALVLDGAYETETLPSFVTALRGICYFHLTVRNGARDLHSGMYGGAALPATHALLQILAAVLPGPDGRLAEPLRAGIVEPTDEEIAAWGVLPPGSEELERERGPAGGRRRRGRIPPAHDRGAVGDGERHRGWLTAAPEDGAARRSARQRLDPARSGAIHGHDHAGLRADAP